MHQISNILTKTVFHLICVFVLYVQYTFNEVIGLPDKFSERSKLQCFNDEPRQEYTDNTIYIPH